MGDKGAHQDLIRRHLDLLQRLGWWRDAERFLRHEAAGVLSDAEIQSRLRLVHEKLEIYGGSGGTDDAGESYIGEDDVVCLKKGGISISYHLKDRDLPIEQIYRSVLRTVSTLREKLRYDIPRVDIALHGPLSEIRVERPRALLPPRSWVDGAYDGTIRIKAGGAYGTEPQRIEVLVAHELVHQALKDISRGGCPRWLHEGLALLLSQGLNREYSDVLAAARREGGLVPPPALEGDELFDSSHETARLAYAQSFSMVKWLQGKLGWDGLRSLAERSGRMSLERALHDNSLNYFLLEREWRRWMNASDQM
ncbi:MAG: hypothetical protein AB1814_00845 [Thermodesulfobacteriota bacterium]